MSVLEPVANSTTSDTTSTASNKLHQIVKLHNRCPHFAAAYTSSIKSDKVERLAAGTCVKRRIRVSRAASV